MFDWFPWGYGKQPIRRTAEGGVIVCADKLIRIALKTPVTRRCFWDLAGAQSTKLNSLVKKQKILRGCHPES